VDLDEFFSLGAEETSSLTEMSFFKRQSFPINCISLYSKSKVGSSSVAIITPLSQSYSPCNSVKHLAVQ
jgi:hypothetical protein